MNTLFKLSIVCLAVFLVTSCGSSSNVDSSGEDEATEEASTPSLDTLQQLPEFDVSRYDTTSSRYVGASSSASSALQSSKAVSDTEEFSRVGCEVKSMKNEIMALGIFAEGFLCLYQIPEQQFPEEFVIPTNSFAYYLLTESRDGEESVMRSRIGYYPNGYGNTIDPVLVLDECEAGNVQTAEMRVKASSSTQALDGAGYYVLLNEVLDLGDRNETIMMIYDTTDTTWHISGSFVEEWDGFNTYGSIAFSYDTENEYNKLSAYLHETDDNELFDVQLNSVFGESSSLAADLGLTSASGGSASVLVDNESFTDGFLFQDSSTVPATALSSGAGDNSDLPFYSELTGMGDLPAVAESSLNWLDGWDCIFEEGATPIELDLTPSAISTAIAECEEAGDAVMEMQDVCGDLDPQEN